jgi:hypothetical protein
MATGRDDPEAPSTREPAQAPRPPSDTGLAERPRETSATPAHASPSSTLLEVAGRAFKSSRAPQTMIAAVLAWSVTVAPSAFARASAPAARLFAMLALSAGLAGPLFLGERRRIGRHLGITTFLALSAGAWLFSLHALHPARLSPLRAATGSLAWAIFALSWREVWPKPAERTEAEGQTVVLPPRASLPPLAVPLLTAAILAALFLVFAAYRTREAERGLVAQAVAVVCGAALVTGAATIAITHGKDRFPGPGRRFNATVVRALVLLVAAALGGALFILLRA